MFRKTYDEEIDALIEKLEAPWDGGPSAGYEFVVSADVAMDAANKILELFDRLDRYEAIDYNRQIGGE